MFLILSALAGDSRLSYMPAGVYWEQIAMVFLSVKLGSIRARETAKGQVLAEEVSL